MYSLDDYNYDLPQERIAQKPALQRDQSKLLFLRQKTGRISHHAFSQLDDLLIPSDLLVINNTEVVPGRLFGRKETGGKVEVLILDYAGGFKSVLQKGQFVCECLVKASKGPKPGMSLYFSPELRAEIVDRQEEIYMLKFLFDGDFESLLYRIGHVPLPPYIRRDRLDRDGNDRAFYQTVYASQKGAVAAPTAGLHFSNDLLEKLKTKGIGVVAITLHVGYGTFLPVRVADIRNHNIHSEAYHISEKTAAIINHAKAEGRRIVAVGTTCVRTLEYAADNDGAVAYGKGYCDLFIYPGYTFKIIDAMITNFHLPKSTLLMLTAAFAGREKILAAYEAAIEQGYRFYSYGDAMLIA